MCTYRIETSQISPDIPPETGPGAASEQKRNSKFWPNGPNEYLGKVKKFQVPTSNGFLWRAEKTTRGGGAIRPLPPTGNLVKAVYTDDFHVLHFV